MSNESILIRGVNWLGDAVMTTPALIQLRAARPTARITLLTHEKLAGLWQDHPAVDAILPFSARSSVFKTARQLRAEKFDLALLLPNSHRSALEAWLAGIPRRIGYARPWRGWLLTDRVAARPDEIPMEQKSAEEIRLQLETALSLKRPEPPAAAHHLHQYLHLVRALGVKTGPVAPVLHVRDEELSAICARFKAETPTRRRRPLIGINPGAEYGPAKRWPKEHFIETAVTCTKEQPVDWWIFGGEADRPLADAIANAIQSRIGEHGQVTSLAGQTTLRELCASLKAVDALLTNDSGPMHVAAAVGTPVVAIFGSTSPELTGPGLPGDRRHQLLRVSPNCAPCFRRECPVDLRCLQAVTPANAGQALRRVLSGT